LGDLVKELGLLRGRRVLVTGSTGFKGGWLCTWLVGLGAKVSGLALPPEPDAPLFGMLRLDQRIKQHFGDIRDPAVVRHALAEEQPDIVIHLAAQALVRRGYEMPKLTFDTNVGGGVNLLEAIRETPSVGALVFVTSDKCYLNKEWIWAYRENDELGGSDPYSSSKAAIETIFAAYQAAYFQQREKFGAATGRAGNVIGGGDRSRDRIVPDCVYALERREPIRLRNPRATRPWQHVLEPVSGYLLLAARLSAQDKVALGSWNFAPNVENVRTVQQLAEAVAERWDGGKVIVTPQADGPHEAQLLMLSTDKAKTLLDWHPRWDFPRAIDQTVTWYREVGAGADAVAITERQIGEYLANA